MMNDECGNDVWCEKLNNAFSQGKAWVSVVVSGLLWIGRVL